MFDLAREIMQVIITMLGFRITSTVRSVEHNREVGGVENSDHLPGGYEAIDFVRKEGMEFEAEKIAILLKMCDGIIKHDAGSGMHYHMKIREKAVMFAAVASAAVVVAAKKLGGE